MFANISIANRLRGSFFLIVLILLVIASVGIVSLDRVFEAINGPMREAILKKDLVSKLLRSTVEMEFRQSKAFKLDRTNEIPESPREFLTEFKERTDRDLRALEPLIKRPKGIKLLKEFKGERERYLSILEKVLLLQNSKAGPIEITSIFHSEVEPSQKKLTHLLDEIYSFQAEILEIETGELQRIHKFSFWSDLSLSLFALIGALGLSWALIRSITRPLNHALSASETVASGNLNIILATNRKDETGKLLSSMDIMVVNLKSLITVVRDTSQIAKESSFEIEAQVESVNNTSQQIAAGSEESSASLEELSSSFQNVAAAVEREANLASQIDTRSRNFVKQLREVEMSLSNLVKTSQAAEISAEKGRTTVLKATKAMEDIRGISQQIQGIVEIITEISEQTNLLSLNASIEAARAGEAGKGFAVVASEISKLSTRTNESIKGIQDLISSTDGIVEQGTKNVDEVILSIESVSGDIRSIHSASESVIAALGEQLRSAEDISATIREVSELSFEVADATKEQKAAVAEISESMQNSTAEAQRLATISQKLASQAQGLKARTEQLDSNLSRFQI
ncbi:signal transduction four helix bundle sensory module [Leptospira inadai serovar Lyme str. 10]|uniref:Signal transduction four helix bundle sensory module n=2 Tax=Leptospira inadai serovar Lyme TaxID=293084 RepID=V6HBR8_9LEPT|nr:methyl-accepting chemotaxis protein [Leptospira inadai]EQA36133.1 signal transduction four helix bundle sensory module [Leptospira inadai serovar Lyme str. 10]PNV74878.1 methyl-accepting chemotaxis protein [Leptospira inadai serovar Lyme]